LHILEEIDINVWQAIVGGQINAETVHGIEPIEIKPGTQSNSTISLNSKGIKLDTGKSGNHYVRINVKIPTKSDLPSNLLELINSELMDKENKKSALEGFASFFKKKE
jgi:curved DNA-binding protein